LERRGSALTQILLSVLVVGAAFGPAAHAGAEAQRVPPPIEPVRYTEDYGYLRSRDLAETDALWPWSRVKYIRLDEIGDVYVTLGSEFRLRYERYEHNNWGEGPQDDDGYLWLRALPLADVHIGRRLRLFGQFINAYAVDLDVPVSPVDEDRADILQAFADAQLPVGQDDRSAVTLRIGRQLLTYGTGRLIDIRYGTNVLQTFDAAKLVIERSRWRLEAFYAQPADHQPGEFDDESSDRESLWSLYGTISPPDSALNADFYYIGYRNDEAVFAETMGRELRHTLGTRVFGDARGWDWNFELFYQFGEFGTGGAAGDISAWSLASDTGYTVQQLFLQPRLALRANVISGDRDRSDRDVQTFNALFPKGKYFGELSPIGPANLIHMNPYATLQLTQKLQLMGNVAFYWRESTNDSVYALGGTDVLRADNGSDSRYIGTQAELLVEYRVDRHLSVAASYSIFTAGAFIKDTGDAETISLVGTEVLYRF
jgi:hypothetical protein